MKRKKLSAFFLAVLLGLLPVFGVPAAAGGEKLQVVATIFPLYDWVREIAGDQENVEITLLMNSGTDMHSYQPAVRDLMKVASCDVFVHIGGESDVWVSDALSEAVNPGMRVLNMVEAMGDRIRTEEIVEGMEHEEGQEEDPEPDEHVWLSLRNARFLVGVIADTLCEADPERAEAYRTRAEAYMDQLADLDARYAEMIRGAAFSTVLFGDRFPFRYLADDYGLAYYAAFSGCYADSEASFETIVFLARKTDELNLPAVMTIEKPRTRIAQTIVDNTREKNQKILSLDSMQSVTAEEISAGLTYLAVMEKNLTILKEALN